MLVIKGVLADHVAQTICLCATLSYISICHFCHWYYIVAIANRLIDPVGRVFANGPRDLGSIPGRIIPKTLKMELGTSLLNTQQYKISSKGKVEQYRERSSTLHSTSV